MNTRPLAVLCLFLSGVAISRAEPAPVITPGVPKIEPMPQSLAVGVRLRANVTPSSRVLESMRSELRKLMASAGVGMLWPEALDRILIDKFIVVELLGSCRSGHAVAGAFRNGSVLASTAVTDGRVLPFIRVDCAAVNRFLRAELARQTGLSRDDLYGRALGRLLAHEVYHVLMQTGSHTVGGVSKTSVSVADLVADNFAFQPEALDQLRRAFPAQENSLPDLETNC